MPVSNITVAKPTPAGKEKAPGPNESELSIFSLRDTLSGITVREANFSEFLAVLKKNGLQPEKSY